MHSQRVHVGGGLRPGAALVVVCLAVVPLQPRSTAPTMTGCCLVGGCEGGCPVEGGRPLRSRAVAGVVVGRLCWLGARPGLPCPEPVPPRIALG